MGGYGPDDAALVKVEVYHILKCCDERLLSGVDMLEREMGMGRVCLRRKNVSMGTVAGNLAPSCIYTYIHSGAIMLDRRRCDIDIALYGGAEHDPVSHAG